MNSKGEIVFSFNWSTWPFVEVGDKNLRELIDPVFALELEAWSNFMLANFDEEKGFSSEEAENWANKQYVSLAKRLAASNVAFTTDNWWS